jgi:hypothetical protein
MKASTKAFLLTALGLATVLLAWGSGVLYWHLRLHSALRTFEDTNSPLPAGAAPREEESQRSFQVLTEAGCRSLPYLVGALDDTNDPVLLSTLTFMIVRTALYPGLLFAEGSSPALDRKMEEWSFRPDAPPEERRIKCDRIRVWWKEQGSEYHQVWRFWTSACKPPERE